MTLWAGVSVTYILTINTFYVIVLFVGYQKKGGHSYVGTTGSIRIYVWDIRKNQ